MTVIRTDLKPRAALLVPLIFLLATCGGGGGGGGGNVGQLPISVPNPGVSLAGIWTGTFSDQDGHYTVSMEIDADDFISEDELGYAVITWGAESGGLDIGNGDFLGEGPDEFSFVYDTFDPFSGELVDTVSGTVFFQDDGFVEGTFETTSGTFGECSLALADGFTTDMVAGAFTMEFSDADTREVFYLGEVIFDGIGNVVPGSGSYLTDDLEGEIDADANVWPITGGYLKVKNAEVGYYEGELTFADPDDTIEIGGYLGLDYFVYAGVFEDLLGLGLFSFVPLD
jgi:hypothetical protein